MSANQKSPLKSTRPKTQAAYSHPKQSLSHSLKSEGQEPHEDPSGENPIVCPLTRLPPVGEVEHAIHACYCYLCTCGSHICPGDYKQGSRNLSSAFFSEYRKEYIRKSKDNANLGSFKDLRGQMHRNTQPIDFLTTKNKDFQPWRLEKNPGSGLSSNARTTYGQGFVGRSSNAKDFPNWGPVEVLHMKHLHLPYRGQQVKLDTQTSYNASHNPALFPPPSTASISSRNLQKSHLFSAYDKFYDQTTASREFRAPKKDQYPGRSGNQNFGLQFLMSSPKHFTTTYRFDYTKFTQDRLPPKKKQVLRVLSP